MGSQPVEFDEFAACLRALKERTGLSYEALARRTGISGSSLHRYCSGSYVPPDYGPAHRFATACGASPEELRRLHRLWALADAARESDRGTEAEAQPTGQPDTEPHLDPSANPVQAQAPDSDRASNPAQAPTPVHTPDPSPDSTPDSTPDAVPSPPPPWHRRASPARLVIALVLALGATASGIAAVPGTGSGAGGGPAGEDRLLFSAGCAKPVTLGRRDACVREVQRLLTRAGAELDVDGDFGPQTLRRVTAFQELSHIEADGVVGEETKKALYEPRVRMATWPPEKVRQRIREVFREAPDDAVAVADCQSFLDPLHIVPNPDGTRNWGVFQISDARLRDLGGTPRDAMDPEWNIRAAHSLWKRAKNFGDWPHCEHATSLRTVEPAQDASASPTRATVPCPAPGQRFKTPTDDRVYLVGPGNRLYYLPDATVYFNLWNDWNGVAVISGGVFADCAWDEARELANAFLARTGRGSRTYIWDAWYGYRLIPNRAVLDRYGFSEARIQTRSSLSPVSRAADWR
ncbi:helix-turn-helix domain-containing protein [Streptomyces sp. NPDC051243]|uniref:helix-turn-helix domain-containing protein n=1 Tax=Streptomyces sp. NPDC051243 TaxID=3365646 RepID=UPI0037B05690